MPGDDILELHRQLRTAQDKYTYFLLAAAASGIALTVNQTGRRLLVWWMVSLALAVFSWGVSFFCGCRYVQYVNSTIFANLDLLRIQTGRHPEVNNDPSYRAAAVEGVRDAIKSNVERAGLFARLQFRCLIAGAVLYIVWHVLEMVGRTFSWKGAI